MQYIVLDLEWNQPRAEQKIITEPILFDSEIIEFGAVKLNERFEAVDTFRSFVRPTFYLTLNGRITGLTGISTGKIEEAQDFPHAFDAFCAWCGDEYALMTWGPTDIPVLMDNMIMHDIPTVPFPICYDLQRIFGHEIMRDEGQCSLEKAVTAMKITGERAHDALNDAKNTAKLCDFLNLETFLDEYRLNYVEYIQFSVDHRIHGAEEWSEVGTFLCPYCGCELVPTGWVHCRSLSAYARCDEGDEFYVSLIPGITPDGKSFLKRTVVEMNDDLWDTYSSRLERAGVKTH